MNAQNGFTLIELMVVILIIAILVGIAVPVFSITRELAWKNSCKANLRIIDGAVMIYRAQNGEFPVVQNPSWADSSDLSGTLVDPDNDTSDLVPYYLKKPIYCPKGGIYTYDVNAPLTNRFTRCSFPDHNQ